MCLEKKATLLCVWGGVLIYEIIYVQQEKHYSQPTNARPSPNNTEALLLM